MEGYSITNISEETIGLYKKCFDLNGSPRNEGKLRWQFLESPVEKRYVDGNFSKDIGNINTILIQKKNNLNKFSVGRLITNSCCRH